MCFGLKSAAAVSTFPFVALDGGFRLAGSATVGRVPGLENVVSPLLNAGNASNGSQVTEVAPPAPDVPTENAIKKFREGGSFAALQPRPALVLRADTKIHPRERDAVTLSIKKKLIHELDQQHMKLIDAFAKAPS